MWSLYFSFCLYAIYQRTQSESKSQLRCAYFSCKFSVRNLSKNTIWKQITTRPVSITSAPFLYAIYQRTQSESKSQLVLPSIISTGFCTQSIKEHNLKANHNGISDVELYTMSVRNLSKNTIWKQITTSGSTDFDRICLYAIYQRTQSESKSQPWLHGAVDVAVCTQSIKEHNLKANHNCAMSGCIDWWSVRNLSKNTIWKQITTSANTIYKIFICTQSIKEHNLKANHNSILHWYFCHSSVRNLSKNTIWKQITTRYNHDKTQHVCTQSIKEHNLKANHNFTQILCATGNSVRNLSKNTIWKQITTYLACYENIYDLYAIYQRTQSESKSQLDHARHPDRKLCTQSIKEHNLKANHNCPNKHRPQGWSVRNLSKNTIWKQITTYTNEGKENTCLYAIYQRTQSESKSQLRR